MESRNAVSTATLIVILFSALVGMINLLQLGAALVSGQSVNWTGLKGKGMAWSGSAPVEGKGMAWSGSAPTEKNARAN